jgi:hypothetical protein
MKYASVFATVLIAWIAFIVMGAFIKKTGDVFALYILMVGFTVGLFLIGFGRK